MLKKSLPKEAHRVFAGGLDSKKLRERADPVVTYLSKKKVVDNMDKFVITAENREKKLVKISESGSDSNEEEVPISMLYSVFSMNNMERYHMWRMLGSEIYPKSEFPYFQDMKTNELIAQSGELSDLSLFDSESEENLLKMQTLGDKFHAEVEKYDLERVREVERKRAENSLAALDSSYEDTFTDAEYRRLLDLEKKISFWEFYWLEKAKTWKKKWVEFLKIPEVNKPESKKQQYKAEKTEKIKELKKQAKSLQYSKAEAFQIYLGEAKFKEDEAIMKQEIVEILSRLGTTSSSAPDSATSSADATTPKSTIIPQISSLKGYAFSVQLSKEFKDAFELESALHIRALSQTAKLIIESSDGSDAVTQKIQDLHRFTLFNEHHWSRRSSFERGNIVNALPESKDEAELALATKKIYEMDEYGSTSLGQAQFFLYSKDILERYARETAVVNVEACVKLITQSESKWDDTVLVQETDTNQKELVIVDFGCDIPFQYQYEKKLALEKAWKEEIQRLHSSDHSAQKKWNSISLSYDTMPDLRNSVFPYGVPDNAKETFQVLVADWKSALGTYFTVRIGYSVDVTYTE